MPESQNKPRNNIAGLSSMPAQKVTKIEKMRAYEELASFLLRQYQKNRLQNDSNKI